MPSITYWNRLEPRARSNDLSNALSARVRDPAWFLARQWQLAEFRGEDAASPAYIRVIPRVVRISACGAPNQPLVDVSPNTPLERVATAEPFSPDDVATAVEIGQTFDRILADLGATDLRNFFLDAFPIHEGQGDDPPAARLRAVWRGRAIDGIALYQAAQMPSPPPGGGETELLKTRDRVAARAVVIPPPETPPITPPQAQPSPGVPWTVPQNRWPVAGQAVTQLEAWVRDIFDTFGAQDPATWGADRLHYAIHAYTSGNAAVLAADPGRDGELDWHGYDAISGGVPDSVTPEPRAVIPGHVRFRGMPNERFWDFEDGRVDFGGLTPDRRDLASLVLMDFMLVQGNDWYLVPFELASGSLCRCEIEVVDVFGEKTAVPRADTIASSPSGRWSMFSTTKPDGKPANYFLLPDSTSASSQLGPTLEEVRFLRDETANLVWAVEHATEGHLGTPWLGLERATSTTAAPVPVEPSDAALRYRLQTSVPGHWIPFQPVALAQTPTVAEGEIALERAALLAADAPPGAQPALPAPLSKILRPQILGPGPYRIREEEVPREGTRVSRVIRWSRGSDGRAHLWVSRRRSTGTGEGWSGLRYDLAEQPPPKPSGE